MHKNDKDTHVLYTTLPLFHNNNYLYSCLYRQIQSRNSRHHLILITTEDAAPLGPALDASFDLTRRGANDVEIPVER